MKIQPTTSPAFKTEKEVLTLVKNRYEVPGGTKSAVMRELFVEGYGVKEVHKMLTGTPHFKTLRYQMVRNYYTNWFLTKK